MTAIRTLFRFVQRGLQLGFSLLPKSKKGRLITSLVAAGLLIAAIGLTLALQKPADAEQKAGKTVVLKSVRELSSGEADLSVVGEVTSRSEATILAESSGKVTRVSASLGDYVGTNSIIATLENARERAQVLQAQSALDSARIALSRAESASRNQSTTAGSAQTSLELARSGAVNSLLSAYASMDEAIKTTDGVFSNPQSTTPSFTIDTSASRLSDELENRRVDIQDIIETNAQLSRTVNSSSNLELLLTNAETDLRSIRAYLDTMNEALSRAIGDGATTAATYKTYAGNARTSVTASLAAMTAAKQSLKTSASQQTIANENLDSGTQNDIAAARAGVRQAEAGLALAQASLEQTIIRAPIAGTINFIDLKVGNSVSMNTPVARVANNNALEVVAEVSELDRTAFVVNSPVSVEDSTGVVTKVAPGLNPITKRIEVRIAITGDASFVDGQSVRVRVARNAFADTASGPLTLPLSVLKITADGPVVFTVEEGVLVAHPIKEGNLIGDRIVILEGVTADMILVEDARGLKAGTRVTVAE